MKWKQVGTENKFYVLEYQAAAYARTNCCAVRSGNGFLILSPASNVTDQDILELEKIGPVLALLAPHPGHTLGILDWLKLRPKLKVYAAPGAIPRLTKVCKVEVLPIAELPFKDGSVTISLAPGMGETTLFIEVISEPRSIIYVDEILEDLDRYPGPIILRPLMYVMGKRPGFQVNSGFIRFYVKDIKALAQEVIRRLATNPHVVFAHGPIRSSTNDIQETLRLLNSIPL